MSSRRTLVSITEAEAVVINRAMVALDAENEWQEYGEKQTFRRAWTKVQTALPTDHLTRTPDGPRA